MPRGKHCDDPNRIKAGTRYDPELEEASSFFEPFTEGMCTGTICRTGDIEAWQNAAEREFASLERQTSELEAAMIKEFGSVKDSPNDFKAVLNSANNTLGAWEQSWKNWEPGYEENWREFLGGAVIHSLAKESIRDIINQFRDAACIYDELIVATSEVGGYIPPEEKKQLEEEEKGKKKGDTLKTALVVGALATAGYFGYKTISSK